MASKKRKILKTLFTIIKMTLIMFFAFCLAGYFSVKMYLASLEPIPQLENYNRNIVTQIFSSDEKLIKTFQTFHYQQVTINQIPKFLKDAIISTEDKNFYSHDGYDILGIIRSAIVNVLDKRASQGASTITQQLARVLFLSNEKTYERKIKEIQIAARIEKSISKDKILEMYLNNVYLGAGSYGVGAAASTYFNKKLSELTLAECALLAGLPQAPSAYNPYKDIKKAEKRRNKVLKRMYIMKTITKKEYDAALNEKIVLNKTKTMSPTNVAPYFVDYVLRELDAIGFDEEEITQGGYKIITTLDYDAQVAANEAIDKNMKAWKLTGQKQNAALFSFSPMNGAILAYCGGKDYSYSQYDRVTQAVRPPGSAFKPILYAAAVKSGKMPTDKVEDTPVTIGEWSPHNYGEKYKGIMPLYKALAFSSNVVAVKLIQELGIDCVIEMAKDLGITTPLTRDFTISLGSNGVKLYDMVVAYGVFANGGYRVQPYAIEKIETQRGKVVYQAKRTKIDKVLDSDTAGIMTAMLRKVITNGTGRGANINKPMAGKTGTTNENKDAWFIGYTPDIVTGVFIGNDDNKSIGYTGGTVPARIWKDMMLVATEKYGKPEFDYPEVDFTINFEEISYEELQQRELESQQGFFQNLFGGSTDVNENRDKKTIDLSTFRSIPVQINIPIEEKFLKRNKDKKENEESEESEENVKTKVD